MSPAPSLYDLLPPLYRARDAALDGQPLAALAGVLDEARSAMADDIGKLYRDWFVETAAMDALASIAGLVGLSIPADAADPRRLVAEALLVDGTKGTRSAAERRLSALCGWPVRIAMSPDAYAVRIEAHRQKVITLMCSTPASVGHPCADRPSRRYRFHPGGGDAPLYEPDWRLGTAIAPTPPPRGPREAARAREAWSIHLRQASGEWTDVPAAEIGIADLTDWDDAAAASDGRSCGDFVVDPWLGRLLLPKPVPLKSVAVSCRLAGEPGLGCLPDEQAVDVRPPGSVWRAYVTRDATSRSDASDLPVFQTLAEGVAAFGDVPKEGEIRIADSGVVGPLDIRVDDVVDGCPDDPQQPRRLTIAAIDGQVPCLWGDLRFSGSLRGLEVTLAGLWVVGRISVSGNVVLRLVGCSVHAAPPDGPVARDRDAAVRVRGLAGRGGVFVLRSMVGPLELEGECLLEVRDSVVDGEGQQAVAGHATATFRRSTVIGATETTSIDGTDTLFDGPVFARGRDGTLATCLVPEASAGIALRNCVDGVRAGAFRFAATRWYQPGYARLEQADAAILTGSGDGGEIGAGHDLLFTARDALLREHASSLLPLGMEWELIYR